MGKLDKLFLEYWPETQKNYKISRNFEYFFEIIFAANFPI